MPYILLSSIQAIVTEPTHSGPFTRSSSGLETAEKVDSKLLKSSLDAFNDVKAQQMLIVFAADAEAMLGHIEIDGKIQRDTYPYAKDRCISNLTAQSECGGRPWKPDTDQGSI